MLLCLAVAASEPRNELFIFFLNHNLIMILISSFCQKVINLRTHQRFAKEILNTEYYLVWILWVWMAFQQVMLQRRIPNVFKSSIQSLIFSHIHMHTNLLAHVKIHNLSQILPATHRPCQSKITEQQRHLMFFHCTLNFWVHISCA